VLSRLFPSSLFPPSLLRIGALYASTSASWSISGILQCQDLPLPQGTKRWNISLLGLWATHDFVGHAQPHNDLCDKLIQGLKIVPRDEVSTFVARKVTGVSHPCSLAFCSERVQPGIQSSQCWPQDCQQS
jgi:hypothetical protein